MMEQKILADLTLQQLNSNTTRGSTPGLVNVNMPLSPQNQVPIPSQPWKLQIQRMLAFQATIGAQAPAQPAAITNAIQPTIGAQAPAQLAANTNAIQPSITAQPTVQPVAMINAVQASAATPQDPASTNNAVADLSDADEESTWEGLSSGADIEEEAGKEDSNKENDANAESDWVTTDDSSDEN